VQRRGAFRSGNSPDWKLLAALFRQFFETARRLDHEPVLLIIPTRLESFAGSIEQDLETQVLKLGCALGFVTVSLPAPFSQTQAERPATPLFRPREDGGHFSVDGHRLTAQMLAAALAGRDSCAELH